MGFWRPCITKALRSELEVITLNLNNLKYDTLKLLSGRYMVEKEKIASKTYTHDEIKALLKNTKEEIPPASGARDWKDNPTRFKLREAKHFLNIAHYEYTKYINFTTNENRDTLLFTLSAFLSSIRSITGNYMDSQYGDKPGFKEWYKKQNLGSDPEIVFLNKARVGFVHLKPRVIATQRGVPLQGTMRLVYSKGDPRKETELPLPETLPPGPEPLQITTYDVIFPLDEEMAKLGLKEDLPVMEYCDRQYKKIESLVFKCEELFLKGFIRGG